MLFAISQLYLKERVQPRLLQTPAVCAPVSRISMAQLPYLVNKKSLYFKFPVSFNGLPLLKFRKEILLLFLWTFLWFTIRLYVQNCNSVLFLNKLILLEKFLAICLLKVNMPIKNQLIYMCAGLFQNFMVLLLYLSIFVLVLHCLDYSSLEMK